jgi:hypothetical protein
LVHLGAREVRLAEVLLDHSEAGHLVRPVPER